MLVLTRKRNQSIIIGDNIEITVVDIHGEQIKLGINAPRSVPVHRKEVYEEIQRENLLATKSAGQNAPKLDELGGLFKK